MNTAAHCLISWKNFEESGWLNEFYEMRDFPLVGREWHDKWEYVTTSEMESVWKPTLQKGENKSIHSQHRKWSRYEGKWKCTMCTKNTYSQRYFKHFLFKTTPLFLAEAITQIKVSHLFSTQQAKKTRKTLGQTSQELRMLSSVTLNCQVAKIVKKSSSQWWKLSSDESYLVMKII